ncbi:ribonuclease H, partial [Trifolium pratense]
GLCVARQRGLMNVELQIDSLAVVKNLEGKSIGSNGGRSLIRRIQCLLQGWNVRVRHIYREANKVADALASIGCQSVGCIMFDIPSIGIDQLCLADRLGVTTPELLLCNSL